MSQPRILLHVGAIAAISTGSAVLFELRLPGLDGRQRLLLLLVVAVVTVVIVKVLSRRQQSTAPSSVTISSRYGQELPMHAMKRYFAWIEKQLAELVEREQLHCGLVRMRRGPLVITVQLRLINPSQRDLQRLLKLGPALAQLLQVESVRIADTAQGILIEIPSPKPQTPNGARLAQHARGLVVPIGVDVAAKPVLVNLQDHGALFWVGPSRRGKTQSMKSALYALLRSNMGRLHFVVIASPAKVTQDWGVLASVSGCLGIASSREEIEAATQWLVDAMNSGELANAGSPTLLVVDDLPNILKAVPQIKDDLADIASMGAGLGVHLLVGTQGAGSKRTSGGTDIENNVTARVLYRPATSRTGSQSAGMAGLELHQLSSAKGDAIALIDGHATRIATAWIQDREIALLPQQEPQPAPWRMQNNPEQPAEQARTTWNKAEQGVEQPETGQNNRRTGQNNPEQPVSPIANGYVNGKNGHATTRTSEHVLEQATEQPAEQGVERFLRRLASLPIEELKDENLGLDATQPPTYGEQNLIAAAYELTDSVRKTCFMAYGHYNGKVRDYVKAATNAVDDETEKTPNDSDVNDNGIPEHIDLNTEEGRATLALLQREGLLRWPDPQDLYDQDER